MEEGVATTSQKSIMSETVPKKYDSDIQQFHMPVPVQLKSGALHDKCENNDSIMHSPSCELLRRASPSQEKL